MNKKYLTFILLLLWITPMLAQSGKMSARGIVTDSSGVALVSATAVLLQAADSVLTNFSLTDKNGQFELIPNRPGDYLVQISYLGYEPIYKPVLFEKGAGPVDLGTIPLLAESKLLKEVKVTAERLPIQIKNDTIEFDANSFQTQPTDVVEDLLRKLPGVEVERDGTIRAQGEEVQRVMVDGKEFFGNDPKIATKNLPADAVDKVQVYDKKSDMAEFSGIEDGRKEKTINIELKEDKKKGFFGNAELGGGTMGRYAGKTNINRFSPQQQLSFIGMANNTNQQGFSINDYINFMGGMQSMMSGGQMRLQLGGDNAQGMPLNFGTDNGFTTTWAGGLNFNNELSDKTEINGSYFFSRLNNDLDRTLHRENFFSDTTLITDENTIQKSLNTNHRFNFTLDHEFDKKQSIKFKTNFGYNDSDFQSINDRRTLKEEVLKNEGDQFNLFKGENYSFRSDLLYRRKFNKKGRTFSTNLNFGLNEEDQDGQLDAMNRYFGEDGSLAQTDTLVQDNLQENNQVSFGARASYTEPIGKKKYLEFNYAYQKNANKVNREVYEMIGPNDANRVFNEQLSNRYNSDYIYNQGGVNFKLNHKKYNFSTGLSVQHSQLNGDLLISGTTLNKSFVNYLPNLRWNYEFSMDSRMEFSYETGVREPSINQLQPIFDNRNPLDTYTGNPNLQPEYSHTGNLRFMTFNQATLSNFFVNLSTRYTTDKIGEFQTIDSLFVRNTMPVNVKDDFMSRVMLAYGAPLRFMKARINIHVNGFYNQGLSIINGVDNQTERLASSIDLRLENRFKEKVDISVGVVLSYNQTQYSLDKNLDQDYLNQSYYLDFTWKLPKGFTLETDFDYAIYNGRSDGFNQEVPIWNATFSKYIFKDQRGQIRISANDLLNQNIGINRRAELNFVEDERIKSLGQYFMVSFFYSLKGFGSNSGPNIQINGDRF